MILTFSYILPCRITTPTLRSCYLFMDGGSSIYHQHPKKFVRNLIFCLFVFRLYLFVCLFVFQLYHKPRKWETCRLEPCHSCVNKAPMHFPRSRSRTTDLDSVACWAGLINKAIWRGRPGSASCSGHCLLSIYPVGNLKATGSFEPAAWPEQIFPSQPPLLWWYETGGTRKQLPSFGTRFSKPLCLLSAHSF